MKVFARQIFNASQPFALTLWLLIIFFLQIKPDFIQNGFMSITMLIGSFVAGATSEGGGAVAFPVMTLFYDISPSTARDFSLMIQAFGMGCASYTILRNKIPVATSIIKYAFWGSLFGQFAAFSYFEQFFEPNMLKIAFTSFWLSFAFVLYLQLKNPIETSEDSHFKNSDILLILLFSFLGGIITGLTGSGIDILTYSLAVLYLGIPEKIATPTSVILMATSSITALLIKQLVLSHPISHEAISYWLVCVPVVIFGAPMGAVFINVQSREFVIKFLQFLIVAQFIYSWTVTPMSIFEYFFSVLIILLGLITFFSIWKVKKV